jgi:hypothetical protein
MVEWKTVKHANARTDMGFVEGLTVVPELWWDGCVQLRHQWNGTGRRQELQVQSCFKSKLSCCCPIRHGTEKVVRISASDCNVDITGDVTIKCRDAAVS